MAIAERETLGRARLAWIRKAIARLRSHSCWSHPLASSSPHQIDLRGRGMRAMFRRRAGCAPPRSVRLRPGIAFVLVFAIPAGVHATDGPDPKWLDRRVYAAHPDTMERIADARLPREESGLLGRNREWGALYSPRFQMGAGHALRMTLVTGRLEAARRAFLALKAGAGVIAPDGRIPSRLPAHVRSARALSSAEIVSAAAFYLGDACLGALALETAPAPDHVASPKARAQLRADLLRGARWLHAQRGMLLGFDRAAPNRLLLDAL
ncbi:MAG: hypothetical protein GWO03_05840, partial [Gammaproteobacteria bacterium]|nr:hypothetical protein [Gammaproteobacteria bacterium]